MVTREERCVHGNGSVICDKGIKGYIHRVKQLCCVR